LNLGIDSFTDSEDVFASELFLNKDLTLSSAFDINFSLKVSFKALTNGEFVEVFKFSFTAKESLLAEIQQAS
jgi:hypothetical protein